MSCLHAQFILLGTLFLVIPFSSALYFLLVGVDGGFDNNEPEYEDHYEIVILPDFVTLPYPSVELPEKVLCPFTSELVKFLRQINYFLDSHTLTGIPGKVGC